MRRAAIDAIIDKTCREATEELVRQSGELLRQSVERLLPQLREAAELELRDRLGATLQSLPGEGAEVAKALLEASRAISAANGQSETLSSLLDGAARFSARCGLFIVRGAIAVGWQARGVDRSVVMRLQFDCATPLLERAMHENAVVEGSADQLPESFRLHCGAPADDRVWVCPLSIHGRVAALLIADGGEGESEVEASALEMITRHTALTLELASSRPAVAHAPEPPAVSAPKVVAPPEPAPVAPPSIVAPEPPVAPEAVAAPSSFRFSPAAEAGFQAPPAPAVTPAPPAPTPVAPPPAPTIAEPAAAVTDELRNKALRFAKLLVEEIKLYKGPMVVRGAQEGDLYHYLQDEIDKSRAVYQKRFGAQIADVDYFREECVRLLANGDSSRLGAGFPG